MLDLTDLYREASYSDMEWWRVWINSQVHELCFKDWLEIINARPYQFKKRH